MYSLLNSDYTFFFLHTYTFMEFSCGYISLFFYSEYIIFLCLILFFVSKFLSFFFVNFYIDTEKLTSYECGFHPFLDARNPFDFKFYLIAIIFLVFDLEIIFLFPWSIYFESINFLKYYSVLIFFLIVSLGLWYEFNKGCLYW